MAAFWEAFGSILAVPGGSGTRSGFWAFPDSAGAAQKRFLGAPGAFLAGVLGVSWGRLGDVLGSLGASLGSSWAVSGRLGNVLGKIFYKNGTKLRHSILNGIVYSILNRFFIELGCPGASKIIKIYYENNTFWF